MVKYIGVNSTFSMKDDYFVIFKKSIGLVFNAQMCKYDSIHVV